MICHRLFRHFAAWMLFLFALVDLNVAQTIRVDVPSPPVFTSLVSFDGTNGAYPGGSTLIQATDGNFYGTTQLDGAYGYGTIFKITPAGLLTTLYNFCSQSNCSDGSIPSGGVVQGWDGNLYGVTVKGGAIGSGTVYKITLNGVLNTLHSFNFLVDGNNPAGTLVQANGNFYGITQWWATGPNQQGSVYKMTPSGTVTTLYYFCSVANCADGSFPQPGLIQASDGNFYGTTVEGGNSSICLPTQPYGCGTIYKITPAGVLTTLHSFDGYPDDGNGPTGGLVQVADSSLYGTTFEGGANNYGTAFKVTTGGALTTIYSFCAQFIHGQCPYGRSPYAGLIQGTDGSLYSATYAGGRNGYGTVYRITPQGNLTVLHSFDSADGAYPGNGEMVQGTDGSFYGTTQNGGAAGIGTIFNLSEGLSPFVETQTTSGKVGSSVVILGTNLTGATSVTFSGTAASFTVVSDSEITATVPIGAASGTVFVTTPGSTFKSNKPFRIVH